MEVIWNVDDAGKTVRFRLASLFQCKTTKPIIPTGRKGSRLLLWKYDEADNTRSGELEAARASKTNYNEARQCYDYGFNPFNGTC